MRWPEIQVELRDNLVRYDLKQRWEMEARGLEEKREQAEIEG